MTQLTFKVTGMHCSSCGLLIDDAVEDVAGVTASSTDVRTHTTVVDIGDTHTDPHQIIGAITALGYSAEQLNG